MNGAQVSAFQANSGIAPSAMATVLVGVVFAVPFLLASRRRRSPADTRTAATETPL